MDDAEDGRGWRREMKKEGRGRIDAEERERLTKERRRGGREKRK